jgi:hypothetical protein
LPGLENFRGVSRLERVESITLQNLEQIRDLHGLESIKHIRSKASIKDNPRLENLSALRGVEAFCDLHIISNDALASILFIEITENDRLCENLDDFFPPEMNLHVRSIADNC